ncbi:MAG: hypothetical protein C4326_14215 [Ignavibacteria bacterium]
MKVQNMHILLATTLFAGLLWLSVSLSDQYQIHVYAPLVVRGIPAGKAIADPLPQAVRLTFSDYGWRLAKFLWGANVDWVIDLSLLPPHHQVLTLRDFAEQIGARLGVQPTAIVPESVYIRLDDVETKRIPIKPHIDVSCREGFGQVGDAVVQPESVTVSGARRVVRSLQSWRTVYQRFDQVRESVDVFIPIADTTVPVAFTPPRLKLIVPVQQLAEKTFTHIPLELVSVPSNREVFLSPSYLDIVVRGGIEQLAELQLPAVRAVVDYRAILADTSGTVEPQIIVPSGLRIVRKTPERVQYVLRKKIVS